MQDVFVISSEAEYARITRLVNKTSKAYWQLKDRSTKYAQQVYSCYLMNKRIQDTILETMQDYKYGRLEKGT